MEIGQSFNIHRRNNMAWLPGYSKRKELPLTGGASGAQTDFQLKLTVSYEAAMDGEFDDIRFTQADGETLVDAWAEVIVTDTSAVVWVEFPTTPANTVEQDYYMYYGNTGAASDWSGVETFEFFDDFESDGCEWSSYIGNPILSPEGIEDLTAWGSTWKDGDTYHIFYSYHDASDKLQVGHATSSDGKSWTKDSANNPILTKSGSGWDDGIVWDPAVWKEGSTWYMLYAGRNSAVTSEAVGLATAANPGGPWTKEATNPVLEGSAGEWDENSAENMNLMKIGSTYYLWYNTLLGAGNDRKSGLATSTNLTFWTKNANNPIFSASGGYFQAAPFKYGSYYYLLITHYTSGGDYSELQLYRDTNPTFYSADRELVRIAKKCGASGWDSHDQDTPCVLTTDINRDSFPSSELWTYYTGESGGVWKTGLLIESDISTALTPCSEYDFSNKWTVVGTPETDNTYVHHGLTSAKMINSEYLSKDWVANKQWAVSMWVYNTQNALVGQWISVLNNLGNRNAILIDNKDLIDNHVYYRLNGGSDTDSGQVASIGWHKIEIEADGTDTKLYFDDDLIATDSGHGYLTKIEFLGDIWAGSTDISWFDQLTVRKYVTNPPTYAFGSEESAPAEGAWYYEMLRRRNR
jgi:hypothetical protein